MDDIRGNPRARRAANAARLGRRLGDFTNTPLVVSNLPLEGSLRGKWDQVVCAVHGNVFLNRHLRVFLYVPFEQTLPVEIWWLHDSGNSLDPYFMPWSEAHFLIRDWLLTLGHVSAAQEPHTAHFISRLQPVSPALTHSNGHTQAAAPDQGVDHALRMVVSAGPSDLEDPRHEPTWPLTRDFSAADGDRSH